MRNFYFSLFDFVLRCLIALALAGLLLVIGVCLDDAHAADLAQDWSATDTALQLGVTAALYEDCRQTEQIAREPNRFRELNPVLGAHPSVPQVRNYFAAAALGSAAASVLLPKREREYLQAGIIGVEIVAIGHNKRVGLSVRF